MASVKIQGNASGTGVFTITAPNSNTDRTLTLPDNTGTVVSTASTPTFTGAVTAPAFIPNSSTVPTDGLYLPAASTVALSTGTTERMRVDSSGNVGIGTSSPGGQLDVYTSSYKRFLISYSGTYTTIMNLGLQGIITQNAQTDSLDIRNSGSVATSYISFTMNTTERARITNAGEFWVAGTTDQGAYNIQCNGTGVWGAGAYVNGSDARIKDDIAPIDSGLDVVEKLNPVTYRYKEDWSKDQSTQTGFIAQELLVALEGKNYVDGVVQQGGSEGYYSVAYQNIIPILTKAIQELNAKVETLEAQNAAFEARLAELEAK